MFLAPKRQLLYLPAASSHLELPPPLLWLAQFLSLKSWLAGR